MAQLVDVQVGHSMAPTQDRTTMDLVNLEMQDRAMDLVNLEMQDRGMHL